MTPAQQSGPAQNLPVYRAEEFRVRQGANLGDPLSCLDDLMLDDVYSLASTAEPQRLTLQSSDAARLTIASDSAMGQVGADIGDVAVLQIDVLQPEPLDQFPAVIELPFR